MTTRASFVSVGLRRVRASRCNKVQRNGVAGA